MLPSKTVPEVNNGKKLMRKPKPKVTATAPPRKRARAGSVEVEEIEDEDSIRNIAARNSGIKKVNCSLNYNSFVSLVFSDGQRCEKKPNLSLL